MTRSRWRVGGKEKKGKPRQRWRAPRIGEPLPILARPAWSVNDRRFPARRGRAQPVTPCGHRAVPTPRAGERWPRQAVTGAAQQVWAYQRFPGPFRRPGGPTVRVHPSMPGVRPFDVPWPGSAADTAHKRLHTVTQM